MAHNYRKRQPSGASSEGLWVRGLPGPDAKVHRTAHLCVHWNWQCFQGRLAESR
uniref:Uncharacterized protein n=1 Tax=Anguilla anguilla TaxID=7936 RepID=A0A0E9QW20_ANGAN